MNGRHGFTLIEISIVLLILGLMLALVMPRLRDPGRASLEGQAKRLAAAMEWLAEEAVFTQRTLRLVIDERGQALIPETLGEDGWEPYVTGLEGALRVVPPVRIAGEGALVLRPDGTEMPWSLRLTAGGKAMRIAFDPVKGRVEVGSRISMRGMSPSP